MYREVAVSALNCHDLYHDYKETDSLPNGAQPICSVGCLLLEPKADNGCLLFLSIKLSSGHVVMGGEVSRRRYRERAPGVYTRLMPESHFGLQGTICTVCPSSPISPKDEYAHLQDWLSTYRSGDKSASSQHGNAAGSGVENRRSFMQVIRG